MQHLKKKKKNIFWWFASVLNKLTKNVNSKPDDEGKSHNVKNKLIPLNRGNNWAQQFHFTIWSFHFRFSKSNDLWLLAFVCIDSIKTDII